MIRKCNRCVMDAEVPDIHFNQEGNCNYCEDFIAMMTRTVQPDPNKRQLELERFIERVKEDGKGKEYDCIIGLSGGVDSAWVLYQAKQLGLRPLAVHMDNGWNSELAQSNIEGLVRTFDVHLYSLVIDWSEYRQLMQAFFDADVVDVELLYDNAMLAANYRLAAKYRIKWILAGTNNSTEGMRMPAGWNWFKYDAHNIRRIGAKSGIKELKSFPTFSVMNYFYYEYIKGIKWVSFLNYLDYKKEDALNLLERECGYRRYPYKHYESIFTRFYQGYILPNKFKIDKRKLHLSTLIVSHQMTRDEAIQKLSESPYASTSSLENDREYFLKKMNWDRTQLDKYLSRAEVKHSVYGSEVGLWKTFKAIHNLIHPSGRD